MGEGIVKEFAMDTYTLLYLKGITNKDLTVQHRALCSTLCGQLGGSGVCGGSGGVDNGYMYTYGRVP